MSDNKEKVNGIPLEALIDTKENIYLITNAAIKRANHLGHIHRNSEIDNEKAVSKALTDVITGEVRYRTNSNN